MTTNKKEKLFNTFDKVAVTIFCLVVVIVITFHYFPQFLSPRLIDSGIKWVVIILFIFIISGIFKFIHYLYKRTRYKISEASIRSEEQSLEYYTVAEQEITDNTYDKGLWSKALVEAKGNEDLRKVEYMKLRVKQLVRSK